ncbi:MAG TPA: ribosomal protein S18-alanine N-acetyltransferase [Nocardioidaceae bacterium]|nr:ribosomal protein S18-alanine N-acetyltransferase [Nocardioidaceae bacterium]
MRLRPATPDDVPALAALEAELFGADAWSEAAVMGEVEGPGRDAVVAVDGGRALGYAVIMGAGDVADLQRIAVAADHQRQGVARALLDEVLAHAAGDGADRMLLEVSTANAAALAFYAAAGFVEIDRRRRYYRDGTDAVVMRHSLRRAACGGRG